jgi:hypothetical protein
MLSPAKPAAAGCFSLKTNKKQILLPRMRDQDDMVGAFFSSLLVFLSCISFIFNNIMAFNTPDS